MAGRQQGSSVDANFVAQAAGESSAIHPRYVDRLANCWTST